MVIVNLKKEFKKKKKIFDKLTYLIYNTPVCIRINLVLKQWLPKFSESENNGGGVVNVRCNRNRWKTVQSSKR